MVHQTRNKQLTNFINDLLEISVDQFQHNPDKYLELVEDQNIDIKVTDEDNDGFVLVSCEKYKEYLGEKYE